MLQMGVFEPKTLQNQRTVSPELINDCCNGEGTEIHPSPDAPLTALLSNEAHEKGLNVNVYKAEMLMLNRSIAELSKLGRGYEKYSPELVEEIPTVDLGKDIYFGILIQQLQEFTAFGRRQERHVIREQNKHKSMRNCVNHFYRSKDKAAVSSNIAHHWNYSFLRLARTNSLLNLR